MPSDQTEITAVSVQYWRHFHCSILKMKAKCASATVVSFSGQKWRHIPQYGSLYNQLTDILRTLITNILYPGYKSVFIQGQQIHSLMDSAKQST